MKLRKYFFYSIIFLVVFTSFGEARGQVQYQVSKAIGKKNVPVGVGGIYYALPKTMFKVKLILEQVNRISGPFAAYAQKLLGTTNYIRYNETYYRLLAVKVEPVSMADPSQVYFIEFPKERSSKNPRVTDFQLNKEGVLISYGMKYISKREKRYRQPSSQLFVYSNNGNAENFRMAARYTRAQKLDTLVRKITIDTLTIKRFMFRNSWVNLSEEDRANDAAKQIQKIRVNRFNLLTGYQEVDYGEGIKYMDTELQTLERQYLILFLGRETKTTIVRSFDFDPEKGHLSRNLLQFLAKDGQTETVILRVSPINEMKNVPGVTTASPDALFYRIPVKARVSVEEAGSVFYSDIFIVPQLGVVTTVTMGNAHLQLDPGTGALVRIINE